MEKRGSEYGVVHLTVEQSAPIQEYIAKKIGLNEPDIENLLWLGSIYLNDVRISGKNYLVKSGDRLRVHTEPRRFETRGELRSRTVKQSDHYIIFDKPSGLPVHALTDNVRENVIALLSEELGIEVFITHRIDIETSGLLLLAKNKEEQGRINSLIRAGEVKRFYQAWASQKVEPGRYTHYMTRSPKAPKSVSSEPAADRDVCVMKVRKCESVSSFEVNGIQFDKAAFKLEIELETGRTQQIRAQLSELGCPIINDVVYGGAEVNRSIRAIALRAFALELDGQLVQI
jgi:23S rRNA pseudouridine1911/1915/1917 synthase